MTIEKAKIEDIDEIMNIYAYARSFMAEKGNPNQWGNTYPTKELIEADIKQQQLYVCVADGEISAVFMFKIGHDSSYDIIEDGNWKNQDEYGVIHRVASNGKVKGFAKICFDYCKAQISNLRIDTHLDNKIMQKALEKNGFEKCGIIYVRNKSPRIAYQYHV